MEAKISSEKALRKTPVNQIMKIIVIKNEGKWIEDVQDTKIFFKKKKKMQEYWTTSARVFLALFRASALFLVF